MTGRGWWCLFVLGLMLFVGLLRDISGLSITALTLLIWFGWEWLFFSLRTRMHLSKLRLVREVGDDRGGPVTTLWQGREYTVAAELHLDGPGRFPYVSVSDPVPFGVEHAEGKTSADGALKAGEPILVGYTFHCPEAGSARFEGLRVEVADLQGFFYAMVFVRAPLVLPILPAALVKRGGGAMTKHHNELLPPGIHRLKQPGSGSELLDLRDYVPGDPPRTIAWKVSARRDRLVTKEFETEVPVRCTLFLDVSSSVRVPSPRSERTPKGFRPLDRMIDLAAALTRASATLRDLTGLCLFDEQGSRIVRPQRGKDHQTRLLQALGEAASLGPVVSGADPEAMLPVAYALAQEVYPDLLRDEVNRVPAFVTWLAGSPRFTRHRRGKLDTLHRTKRTMLLWGTTLIPLGVLALNVALAMFDEVPEWARTTFGALLFFGVPVLVLVTWLAFLFSILVGHNKRKHLRWRKRLAALFCGRALAGLGDRALAGPGALALLLEDDDLFSLHLQAFLVEHQVPSAVPLYDEKGRYLFALPEKVGVLSKALLDAVGRGRDNELFVLCADLLELDGQLDPLLAAVRVALARHHQVMLVCPWPAGLTAPGNARPRPDSPVDTAPWFLVSLLAERLEGAFGRIRRAFARLGVPVVCAGSDESLPLILARIERLRGARPAPGGGAR